MGRRGLGIRGGGGRGRTSRHRGSQGLFRAGQAAALQEESRRGASTHQAAAEHPHCFDSGLAVCLRLDGLPVLCEG